MEDDGASSDDTIIYEIPKSMLAPKKPKKFTAKFVFCTVGIKHFKDMDAANARNYTRKRKFKCTMCTKHYGSTHEINHHFKNTHGIINCEDCGIGFSSPLSLKKHSYTYKACSYKCTGCNKVFAFKSQRDSHQRIHEETERHVCKKPNCDRSFGWLSDLNIHMTLHNKDPIKCKHCEYSNRDIRNMRQHERVHSNEKPYECTRCKKCFKFSMRCIRHECT